MIVGCPHQESNASRIFERLSDSLECVIPLQICFRILKLGIVKSFAAFMLDRTAHAIRIVQSLQSNLTARTGLAAVDRIIRIAFHLDGASLIGAYDQSAGCSTFAACCGVKGA